MYTYRKVCLSCHYEGKKEFDKYRAAFSWKEKKEFLNKPCTRCGHELFSGSDDIPKIDQDLMDEWLSDEGKFFSEQDEDLLIGDVFYLELILKNIDRDDVLLSKKLILFNSLLVIANDLIDDEGGILICEKRFLMP